MTSSAAARRITQRSPRVLMAGLLVVIAAVTAALGHQMLPSSTSSTPIAPTGVLQGHHHRAPASPSALDVLGSGHRSAVGVADGVVPDGTTVFDDDIPAVAKLAPALLSALRSAATDAARDGIEVHLNSGWRSKKYQEQLLEEAVSKYGSKAVAARWVATPETSAHVQGEAVDVGPSAAARWLSEHGDEYGLCQTYGNEPWHYELRPDAVGRGCPAMYADPTHDPRMQR